MLCRRFIVCGGYCLCCFKTFFVVVSSYPASKPREFQQTSAVSLNPPLHVPALSSRTFFRQNRACPRCYAQRRVAVYTYVRVQSCRWRAAMPDDSHSFLASTRDGPAPNAPASSSSATGPTRVPVSRASRARLRVESSAPLRRRPVVQV